MLAKAEFLVYVFWKKNIHADNIGFLMTGVIYALSLRHESHKRL